MRTRNSFLFKIQAVEADLNYNGIFLKRSEVHRLWQEFRKVKQADGKEEKYLSFVDFAKKQLKNKVLSPLPESHERPIE